MSGVNVPNHFIEEYRSNVAHLLQYEGAKLRDKVTVGSYQSNGGTVVDQYGALEMSEVVTRFAPMPRTDAAMERVWIYPRDFDVSPMVDPFDLERMMTDPKSAIVVSCAKAGRRKMDEVIFGAFYAQMKKGVKGESTENFDTTNHRVDAAIGASGDTGLNVDKIIRGKRLLQDAEVDTDMEQVFLAITPEQHEDLLRQTQITSSEYFGRAILGADGNVRAVAGVNIVISTRVPSNASYRLCPMWVQSGMHLGIWSDMETRIDPRPDIQGIPYQIYTKMSVSATRVEAGRVIQIECTEA